MNLYPNSKLILQAKTHGSWKFWLFILNLQISGKSHMVLWNFDFFFYFEAFPNSTNLQEITHIWCYTQTLSKFYRPQHLVHGNFDFLSWIYKSTRNHPWFIEILTFNFEAFPYSTNLQEITHIGTGTQTVSLFYRLQHMVHWNFDFLFWSLS